MKEIEEKIGIGFIIINIVPLIGVIFHILFGVGYYFKDFLYLFKIYLGGFLGNIFLPNVYTISDQILYIIIFLILNFILVFIIFKLFVKSESDINKAYITILIISLLSTFFGYMFAGVTA
ncbi:hypothetical protein HUU51_03335 [Candidatus Gracilibacteria bacterium]|nr:hypothetical protein [Candidatus Gracilibacteria bacterium]